jgi:hypothetical protein
MQYLWLVISVNDVKGHKDKKHRITNSKIVII